MTTAIRHPPAAGHDLREDIDTRLSPLLPLLQTRAEPIDRSLEDPRRFLTELAAQGMLAPDEGDSATPDSSLSSTAHLLSRIAEDCLTSAFAVWAHQMVIDYLSRAPDNAQNWQLLSELRHGQAVGSTAMAAGMKTLVGAGELTVNGNLRPDGSLTLHGRIHWASNLVPGAIIVLPVQLDDGRQLVVRIGRDDPGVHIHPVTGLLALDATASGGIVLDAASVSPDAVISHDLRSFAAGFRPTFLIAQTSLAVGLARKSLASSATFIDRPGNASLEPLLQARTTHFKDLENAWWESAQRPARAPLHDLLRTRLETSLLVGEITRLELTLAGGGGYHALSGPARRFREAAFFPVQSPSEGQLRWELSSSS